MPRDQWDEKIKEFRRQGVDYETGGDIGWFPAAGQRVEDGLRWLEETGLADLLGLVPAVGVVPRIVRSLSIATKLDKLNSEGGAKPLIPKDLEKLLSPEVKANAEKVYGFYAMKKNVESIESANNGKGVKFRFKNENGRKDVVVRFMNEGSGGREKPYYKIGVNRKSAVDRHGNFTSTDKNHIDMDTISVDEVIKIVDKVLKREGIK